jgi:hypothetical protein
MWIGRSARKDAELSDRGTSRTVSLVTSSCSYPHQLPIRVIGDHEKMQTFGRGVHVLIVYKISGACSGGWSLTLAVAYVFF